MPPGPTAPCSLAGLLAEFRPCFTAPTFHTFVGLVVDLIAQTRRRTVCGMLTGAGLDQVWHHSRAHRLFTTARWSSDALGLALADLIVTHLVPVGCQNWATASDQRFQAAASYSLIKPPRMRRRRILPRIGSGTVASGRGGRSSTDRCGRCLWGSRSRHGPVTWENPPQKATGHDRGRVAAPALFDPRPVPHLADAARPYLVVQEHRAPRPTTRSPYSAEPTRGLAWTGPTEPCSPH